MPSTYDILINIAAKAAEVSQAAAAVAQLTRQATAAGGATTAALAQGTTAAKGLETQARQTATAVADVGKAGQEGGAKVAAGAVQATNKLKETEGQSRTLGETLREALTFGAGNQLVERLVEIPHRLLEGVHAGVEFNAEMEKGALAIAGSLRSVDRSITFENARTLGSQALDLLRAKANALGLDFHALTETFAINLPTMYHAGVTELQKQVDLMVLLNQVAASKGISGFQAQRDIIDLLNGMGERTILGKELEAVGVSNESIKQAREAGTLYQFLTEKLGAYGEAGAAAANTFGASQQRFRNQLQQLAGEASKPIFERARTGLEAFNKTLESGAAARQLAPLAGQISALLGAGAGLADFALQNAGALTLLADGVVALGVGFTAAKLVEQIGGLSTALPSLLASLGPVGLGVAAVAVLVSAVVAIRSEVAAQEREAAAQAEKLKQTQAAFMQQLGRVGGREGQQSLLSKLQEQVNALRTEREQLAAQLDQLSTGSESDDARAIRPLLDRREQLDAQIRQLEEQQNQTRQLTSQEMERNAAGEAIARGLKEQSATLSEMIAKLPAFIAGLQTAVAELRQAQALYGMNAGAKADFLGKDQADRFAYISETAAKIRDRLGDDAQHFDATVKSVEDVVRVTKALNAEKDKFHPGVADDLVNLTGAADKSIRAEGQLTQAIHERDNASRTASEAEFARTQKTRIDDLRGRGDKTGADRAERDLDIQSRALQISKQEGLGWDEATRAATQAVDAANRAKDAHDAEKGAAKGANSAAKDARQEEGLTDKERTVALERIRNDLAEIRKNPFITDAEKIPQELELLREEEAQLRRNMAAREDYIAAHRGDPKFAAKVGQYELENERDNRRGTDASREGKSLTFSGGLQTELVQLQNSFALTGKSIGQELSRDIGQGISAVSQGLTNLIFKGGSFRQVMMSALQSIVGGLIELTAKTVVHYAVMGAQMLANKAIGTATTTATVAEQTAAGTAIAAAHAPAAAATSVSSYGVSAVVGAALAIAAIGAIIALLAGGFATGGMIAGSPSSTDNRIASVATGEYIVRSAAVSHYGPAFFEALNNRALPGGYAYAAGGMVGGAALSASGGFGAGSTGGAAGSAAGGPKFIFVDSRQRAEQLLQTAEFQDAVVHVIGQNSHSLGMKG